LKNTIKNIDVTAMDLGTSNTCICCNSKNDNISIVYPKDWYNSKLGGAIPSLVLYKDNKPFLIGAAAELEYGEASQQEKEHYKLQARFKPDIAVSEDAKQYMLDFLELLRERITLSDNLFVGIPCQAQNHYRETLRLCLNQTNWKNAQFLPEPVGALIHYLSRGDLSPSVVAKGVLTVDFGGGTCDLAIMHRADVKAWHGDMLYGGRLFDDLFYQMLIEQNEGLEQQLQEEHNSYYVHWVACRQAKEDFSTAMNQERAAPTTIRVRRSHFSEGKVHELSAYITELTWEQFLLKAGNFKPSKHLQLALHNHSSYSGLSEIGQSMLQGKKVDLIYWFEHILRQCLNNFAASHNTQSSPTVLLTGGSSAWPFVKDIIKQNLGSQIKIIYGDEQYADVAKGLAQFPILSQNLKLGRESLQKELPSFMEKNIRQDAIRNSFEIGLNLLLDEYADYLQKVVLIPAFHTFRADGGPLIGLIQNIVKTNQDQGQHLENIINSHIKRISRKISNACQIELQNWFKNNGIPLLPETLKETWLTSPIDILLQNTVKELGQNTYMATYSTLALGTMLTSTGLVALSITGTPLLALAVGVGSTMLMKFLRMDTWVANTSLQLSMPSFIRHRLFSDKRILAKCEEQLTSFKVTSRKLLLEEWNKSEVHIISNAVHIIEKEISALDLLNITPV